MGGKRSSIQKIISASIILLAILVLGSCGCDYPSSTKDAASAGIMPTSSSAAPTPSATIQPTPTPAKTPAPAPTAWGGKFPGKFTNGEIVKTENSYKSAHINVSIQKVQKAGASYYTGVTYFVADIYVTDLKYFKSAFTDDKFDSGNRQYVDEMSKNKNAVVAINGDYCTVNKGTVVRNGVVYRKKAYKDTMVMYNDGSMQTILKGHFNFADAQRKGIWQAWTFGPQLLQNGQPMTKFNSSVTTANPRTAIGYYEPGHYCFVTVDGRQPGYSVGYALTQLSQLFYDLGCKVAFNLDGGGSAQMAFMGKRINSPCINFRRVDDMLYITDTP